MSEPAKKAVKRGGRVPGTRTLTPKQRAEAVALWRGGGVTLDDLAKKFGRRPETFSRLFKKLGIEKGSAVKEEAKKLEAAAAEAAKSSIEETLRRIAKVKDDHFQMANGLAKLAWAEIVRARQAELPLHTLKETMATLKMASDVINNSRKELYEILDVEKHEAKEDEDDLPDLTVRELTPGEVQQIQNQSADDGMDMAIPDTPVSADDIDIPEA